MNITKATYGGVDCLSEIKDLVKSNQLIVRANNSIIGDPMSGVVKYLELELDGTTYRVKEGDTFVYPKSNTNRLGVWYSNDTNTHPAIKKSLESIQTAAKDVADIITCPWVPIHGNPFHEVYGWNRTSSHLTQLLQILQCIYVAKSIGDYKYISFLEHDVMYGEGYFSYPEFDRGEVWTNMNYGGINSTGWQRRGQHDEPMHQMTLRMEDAVEHFHAILGNALVTNNGNIEPQLLTRKQWESPAESIHINHGSHFTSHYTIYQKHNTYKTHPYWGEHDLFTHLFTNS